MKAEVTALPKTLPPAVLLRVAYFELFWPAVPASRVWAPDWADEIANL